ncbi:MAG: lysylphosphatidylglycerol synthase transmembrane domain-containing protein [Bacteroidota bacterium]
MDKRLLNVIKFLGFLSIGLVILYLVYQRQASAYLEQCISDGGTEASCSLVDKVLSDFASANFFWIFMTMLAFIVSNISRAIRWNMLLNQLGYQPRLINSFLTISLGYFANLGIPRMGEFVRAGSLARYEKIPVEQVMGTVVVDRIIDVICILIMTALAVALAFSRLNTLYQENADFGDKLASLQAILLPMVIVGLVGLVLLLVFRKKLLATKLGQRVENILSGFVDGIKTVGSLSSPGLFLMHTGIIWLMYFLITYFCFFSFAPTASLSPVAGLVTFVAGGWGIVVPSPGGMGSYHFLTGEALKLYGVGAGNAFSWSNIAFFTVTIGVSVLVGLVALLLLPRLNQDYNPEVQQKVEG